jgi:hypothetical protein
MIKEKNHSKRIFSVTNPYLTHHSWEVYYPQEGPTVMKIHNKPEKSENLE